MGSILVHNEKGRGVFIWSSNVISVLSGRETSFNIDSNFLPHLQPQKIFLQHTTVCFSLRLVAYCQTWPFLLRPLLRGSAGDGTFDPHQHGLLYGDIEGSSVPTSFHNLKWMHCWSNNSVHLDECPDPKTGIKRDPYFMIHSEKPYSGLHHVFWVLGSHHWNQGWWFCLGLVLKWTWLGFGLTWHLELGWGGGWWLWSWGCFEVDMAWIWSQFWD